MITSIASQKGGTGKTTTSISLAAGLARRGDRVLLIDVDSQANSSKVLIPDYPQIRKDDTIYVTIMERHPLPVAQTTVENLDIVASHILLSNTDVELTTYVFTYPCWAVRSEGPSVHGSAVLQSLSPTF